mmetsp:Transcript_53732/g.151010  ORF Transcript_53732/g.151010 Transcript_53732/m.151010 type:complete len:115 (-) Transcript_53732:117-461(-)
MLLAAAAAAITITIILCWKMDPVPSAIKWSLRRLPRQPKSWWGVVVGLMVVAVQSWVVLPLLRRAVAASICSYRKFKESDRFYRDGNEPCMSPCVLTSTINTQTLVENYWNDGV